MIPDEFFANQKGLGQAVRAGLHGILQVEPLLAAVSQKLSETRRTLRGADDEDVTDPCQHQCAERLVDHGLVENGQQLLADRQRGRMQTCSGTAGEDDAFACHAVTAY